MTQPDYLFIGTFPTCYVYADMRREKNGEYHEIGRIYFSPLRVQINDNHRNYSDVHSIIYDEYEHLQTVDSIQVSATGQTARITH
jgi:hypothetical protein